MLQLKSFIPIKMILVVGTIIHLFSLQIPVASEPPKSPDQGSPSGREGAATRGSCEKTSLDFTPVLPRPTDQGFTGFTLKGHPTFWFFIPYKTDSVSSGKFMLREREGSKVVIHRVTFKLPKTPGFVSVTIPNTAPTLEKNKQYIWKLVLDCASQNSDQPPNVSHEGLVQRVDMANLESQLQTAKLPERIRLYIENKIWYDAASDLANIRELPEVWITLLKAMELEQLKPAAIGGEVVQNRE